MILLVGLTLGKRCVDGALVVIMTGKLLDIIAHENITLTQRLLKTDALETGAAGQGNIRLSARKDTTREINLHLVEGEGPGSYEPLSPKPDGWGTARICQSLPPQSFSQPH